MSTTCQEDELEPHQALLDKINLEHSITSLDYGNLFSLYEFTRRKEHRKTKSSPRVEMILYAFIHIFHIH